MSCFVEEHILPLVQKTGNIVGLKISGLPDKVPEAKRLLDVPVLCGWDLMSLLEYQLGADGVISGSATLIPRDEVQIYELAKQERWDEARDIYYGKMVPLLNYCTFDPHAYSVSKYALYYQGVIDCPGREGAEPRRRRSTCQRGACSAQPDRSAVLRTRLASFLSL